MIRKLHFHDNSDREKADRYLFSAVSLTLARDFVFMDTPQDIEEVCIPVDTFPSLNLDPDECEDNPEDIFEELKQKLKPFSCIGFEGNSINDYSIFIKKGTKLSLGDKTSYSLEFILDGELPINLVLWDLYIIAEYAEPDGYEEL